MPGDLPATVSTAVAGRIADAVPDATVRRIAGADRYETAARVAEHFFGSASHAFLASGEVFSDAVSASGVAAAIGDVPVLLTPASGTSAHALDALEGLGVETADVIGGSRTISDASVRAYRAAGYDVERIGGADRYAANAALATAYVEPTDDQTVAIASGEVFPDALSASMVAGVHGAPVLLATGACVTLAVEDAIARFAPTRVVNIGGPATLAPDAWRTGC